MTEFGTDYFDDRAQFRALADAAGCERRVRPIRARGPRDETLTIDVARIGSARARRALVVLSGVHGVEGPAGSALQRQWLTHDLPAYHLPDDGAVWLLHAVNPFGYAWHRRWNEDNVDLNRNFVDFDAPLPARPDYATLDGWLNPRELGDPVAFRERGRTLVAERGLPWLHRTLIEGQHDFPRGLYFAGRSAVESNLLLRELFAEILTDCELALIVDLHTGMGDYGDCLYLPGHEPATAAFDWLTRRFNAERVVVPTQDDSSPAVPVAGKLSEWLRDRYPRSRYLTVEFGTVGGERMIAAERAENWLFHHGDRSARAAVDILREVRETSAPSDPRWRRRVLVQGAAVLADAYRAVLGTPRLKRRR
jgi:polar amino acid transport system ATP-binding protein